MKEVLDFANSNKKLKSKEQKEKKEARFLV